MSYLDNAHVLSMIDQGIAYLEERIAVESDPEHIQTGLDYITPANAADTERYNKVFTLEYEHLQQESENHLQWLRELRRLFE